MVLAHIGFGCSHVRSIHYSCKYCLWFLDIIHLFLAGKMNKPISILHPFHSFSTTNRDIHTMSSFYLSFYLDCFFERYVCYSNEILGGSFLFGWYHEFGSIWNQLSYYSMSISTHWNRIHCYRISSTLLLYYNLYGYDCSPLCFATVVGKGNSGKYRMKNNSFMNVFLIMMYLLPSFHIAMISISHSLPRRS